MKVACKGCDARVSHGKTYCGLKCQAAFRKRQNVEGWLSGEIPGWTGKTRQIRDFVRRHLHDTLGSACSECGWNEVHPVDGKVLTEVDHIDGDAENCVPSNLRILCPNCHSKTPTFRARNKTSARKR
jgi:5-methylcytosine-specific restriction endonuclease McrA